VEDQKLPANPALRMGRYVRQPEKAELRPIRIHDLRHTYASLLLQQGESIVYVKD
jgi:integrase